MSLSDFSELTDISSEDDVPLVKSTSRPKKAPKEYKISHVLRAPRTAQYTAKSLYDQIIDNSIDLDPEYQRDVVWQEEKQSGLIDSILRNYYIPPIIFAVTVQDDGSELRTCIDGKQRLTSIQRFIDGQIPHKDSFTNERLWFKSSATNARRKLLPQHLRTLFTNKQVVCVEYTGLDNDQEREIFQRVQLGVALTPAERLQALVGPWSTVIREIQNQVLGAEGFEGYLDWGHARGRDFQCLATIGYLIENHPKTTVPGPKTLEKWLQKTQPVSTQLRTDLHETFRIFVTLARDKKYSGSLNRPTRVSPIEFVTIGVLIYLKRETLSLTQISSAIEKMRKDVRASHQDIRSNARVTKHLMDFMAKKIKVSELKSDGEGDKPAAMVIAKSAKPAKRKRPVYSESDDSDMEPSSNVKPAKHSANTEASNLSRQTSTASQKKMNSNSTKKTSAVPQPNTSTKSLQPFATSRTTNNSLSNFISVSSKKSPLPVSATEAPRNQASPPPTLNGHSVLPSSATSNPVQQTPLTVQTSSAVKVESPQMNSLSNTVGSSAVDRLAPIRAAKASLFSTSGAESPVSQGSERRQMFSPDTKTPQTLVDFQQNPPVVQPTVSQATNSYQQQPLLSQSSQPPRQQLSSNGRPISSQVEGALRSLHSQFPQLTMSAQRSNSGAISPATYGQNVNPSALASQPLSTPGFAQHNGPSNSSHTMQGYRVAPPQGPRHGNVAGGHPNLNQATFGPYAMSTGPSSSSGMSGTIPIQQQPTTTFFASSSAGLHALPQRPAVPVIIPNRSMRAEPLGPPPRSASSESAIQNGRRGSYNKDRHRPWDDGHSERRDRYQDYDRDKRNWSRPSRFS